MSLRVDNCAISIATREMGSVVIYIVKKLMMTSVMALRPHKNYLILVPVSLNFLACPKNYAHL